MSGKGHCYDNAVVRLSSKPFKAGADLAESLETRRKAEMAIFELHQRLLQSAPPSLRHGDGKSPVCLQDRKRCALSEPLGPHEKRENRS